MPKKESFSEYGKKFERSSQTPRITIEGNHEVTVEGYQHIYRYDENCIFLALKKRAVQIDGVDLHIKLFTRDVLVIEGDITSIGYSDLGEHCD